MNSSVPPRLDRLLGEYERLTRNEGAALRVQDFPALAELFTLKGTLLEEIAHEGKALGVDRRVLWFNDCLVALGVLERENLTYAARFLGELRVQRQSLAAARKRLRSMGQAYRGFGLSSSRLFAFS